MLPLCAAAGDQSPSSLLYQQQEAEMRDRYGLSERQEIAQRVGMAVERALQSTRPETEPVSFRHRKMRVELSPVSIERQQRDWALSELERCRHNTDPDSWWPRGLQAVIDCFDGVEPLSPVPIHSRCSSITAIVSRPAVRQRKPSWFNWLVTVRICLRNGP